MDSPDFQTSGNGVNQAPYLDLARRIYWVNFRGLYSILALSGQLERLDLRSFFD